MDSVLGSLLEGFAPDAGPVVLDGRIRPGDRVRVAVKGGESIVGRAVRPSDLKPKTHLLVAPEGGGPHVEASIKATRHDTPEQHGREAAKREAERLAAPPPGVPPKPGGASPQVQTDAALRAMGKGAARLQPEAQRERERHGGRVVECLLGEAFGPGGGGTAAAAAGGARMAASSAASGAASAPRKMPIGRSITAPAETPAQSRARAAAMVKQAQQGIANFNALHPRNPAGKFATKGGSASTAKSSSSSSSSSKRATSTSGGILGLGSSGTLVKSIQRQLHLPATGTYNAQTQAAIVRYQRQHGLLVDGRVGAQTLASLRGNPNAKSVKPGPIPASAARVTSSTTSAASSTAKSTAKPKVKARVLKGSSAPKRAPVRAGGGVVI